VEDIPDFPGGCNFLFVTVVGSMLHPRVPYQLQFSMVTRELSSNHATMWYKLADVHQIANGREKRTITMFGM
jgi:hypothetical protein